MAFNNLSGTFGSNSNSGGSRTRRKANVSNANGFFAGMRSFFGALSTERWVDIVCISAIVIFLIVVACTWESFSDALFLNILFPVICVLSGVVTAIVVIGAIILYLTIKWNRRRYWW